MTTQNAGIIQIIVTSLLSSGLVGGLVALITKAVWSPEAKNDLARLGNEFAQQLLQEAKSEREELRLTIRELELNNSVAQQTIDRLTRMGAQKDYVISEFERRQKIMSDKIERGQTITLQDVFGEAYFSGFKFSKDV